MNDAWANYQNQNVNFQNIFDRQIKNMKFNNKFNMLEQVVGMFTQAGGTGVGVGMLANPGVGLVAGSASLAAGIADTAILNLKQKEGLSYSRDLYNYNLQNIKAIPETISKVTAFNYNSKYIPYIEVYECTDEEKVACENKIRWNSMSVGRIDTIANLCANYNDEQFIQGTIIRLDSLNSQYAIAIDIKDELKQGIYIKESDIV